MPRNNMKISKWNIHSWNFALKKSTRWERIWRVPFKVSFPQKNDTISWMICSGFIVSVQWSTSKERRKQITDRIIGAVRDVGKQDEKEEREQETQRGASSAAMRWRLLCFKKLRQRLRPLRPPCAGACSSRLPVPAPREGALNAPPLRSELALCVANPSCSATSRCWLHNDNGDFPSRCRAGCRRPSGYVYVYAVYM